MHNLTITSISSTINLLNLCHMGVEPKIGGSFPQSGWWKLWKTLFFNGWFGGENPPFLGNIHICEVSVCMLMFFTAFTPPFQATWPPCHPPSRFSDSVPPMETRWIPRSTSKVVSRCAHGLEVYVKTRNAGKSRTQRNGWFLSWINVNPNFLYMENIHEPYNTWTNTWKIDGRHPWIKFQNLTIHTTVKINLFARQSIDKYMLGLVLNNASLHCRLT